MLRTLTLALAVISATLFTMSSSYARDWVLLGERSVGFIQDHDSIKVGRHEGRFKRIRLHVKGNEIELNSVKVVFGNGVSELLPLHERIAAGGESSAIVLATPWKSGRVIQRIDLNYHSKLNFRGEAAVQVWAQED
jgi:hypothetical protein